MKLSEIILEDEYTLCEADKDAEIKKIATRPEDVEESTLLIIPNISKFKEPPSFKIPPIAVASEKTDILPAEVRKIELKDARATVAYAYFRFYKINTSSFKTIAITGTNGKTSTAHFAKAILKECGKKVGYIGTGIIEIEEKIMSHENYSMTTPDPAELYEVLSKMQNEKCDVIIMEVSSHALALEKTAPLNFDYAIFTNLSGEHRDFHKTTEEYFEAKCKLFKQCKTAVFNIDDPYARRAAKISLAQKNITAGVLHKGDIYATHIENRGALGISYLYRTEKFMFRMNLNIPGIYNVYNSMLAATVCIDLGCPPYLVKQAIHTLNCIPGRFEVIKGDVTVIIDFAHTEVAFECFLREAKKLAKNNSLTVIFGCGGEREKEKRPKMAEIAERYADKIIVTSDNPRGEDPKKIIADIAKGFQKNDYNVIINRKRAIEETIKKASHRDIITIVGKGIEKYIIDKSGYHSFDEKQIISDALKKRR